MNTKISLEKLNNMSKNSLIEHLNIKYTEIGADYIKATMPVTSQTHQPFGYLHGGASVVLAETLASVGANLLVNSQTHICVGLEINANHLKSVKEGFVTGVATPIHHGKSTQVWSIKIYNEKNDLICISRMTISVLEKKTQNKNNESRVVN